MSEDFSRFFKPGCVHRQLYTDPAIFELEMARIFGTAWIYIGHESQVKKPGDYFATQIGRHPVVMVRDAEGGLRVIRNQCAHRGAMVVATEKGSADEFTCCYHGWTYHLDGRLKAVPLNHGYPRDFKVGDPNMSMQSVARVKSYRGFVFASEAADGPDLEESLGHMTTSLDDMIDRAPDGEIEAAGGVFKHAYDGNWKVYFENLCDAAHPLFAHRSSIEASQAQSDDVHSDGSGEIAIRQMRQNGAPYSFWESQVGIWTYPNGHSYLGDYHDDSKLVAALKDPVFRDYLTALEKKKGKAEAQRILEVRRWNSNIYPNVSLMSQFQQLRVVHPIAVNRTVVHTYNFRLKGAPEQMFRNTISFANIVNGTGSLVLTDDLEIYNRIDMGLSSQGAEWLQIGRGYQSDLPDPHGGRKGINSTSEVYIRNMLDAWQGYMSNGHGKSAEPRARRPDADGEEAKGSNQRIAAPSRRRVTPPRGRAQPASAALDLHRCMLFLEHEARLLDEAKFDDWLALFTADAWYWVPSEPDQNNPHDTVSLIYDDRRLLGDAGAAAGEPADVFAGAALADEPHRRQRHDRGRRGPRRHRALEIPDDRISAGAAAAVRRHRVASPGAARRRHPHRLEARRSGQLRRAAGWHHPAVLTWRGLINAQPNAGLNGEPVAVLPCAELKPRVEFDIAEVGWQSPRRAMNAADPSSDASRT